MRMHVQCKTERRIRCPSVFKRRSRFLIAVGIYIEEEPGTWEAGWFDAQLKTYVFTTTS